MHVAGQLLQRRLDRFSGEVGFVHVRLRRVEPATDGAGRPVVLGEAQIELATGTVNLNP